MKYLKYFEENSKQLRLFNDDSIDILFENNKWVIIEPKTYEALCNYGKDQGWYVANGHSAYYFRKDHIYINVNKEDDSRYLFNFYDNEFYGKDEKYLELKPFLYKNEDLLEFYGEKLQCPEIVKDGNDYWFVVGEYSDFFEYFKIDANINEKFIKSILEGGGQEYFEYENHWDIDDYGIKLAEDNFLPLFMVLVLEKFNDEEEYDFDLDDINNYDDICNVINEYDFEELKWLLKICVRYGHEIADSNQAYEELTDAVYNFFNLKLGSAKWKNKNSLHSPHSDLWIKFKGDLDAYYAKFVVLGYDDGKIEYSSPYNGYDGDTKDVVETFNSEIPEKLYDYDHNNIDHDKIEKFVEFWKREKDRNKDATNSEIYEELKVLVDVEKYNI